MYSKLYTRHDQYVLTDSLSEVFGRTKLHKKRIYKYIYIFFIKESYRDFEFNVPSTSNGHFLYQIMLCNNAVLENRDNFHK